MGGACVLLQLFMVASGSRRGSVDVRDAAIVTPQRLESEPAGTDRFTAHPHRPKGESGRGFSIFYSLTPALENKRRRSILALHQEQAGERTNMDAVR